MKSLMILSLLFLTLSSWAKVQIEKTIFSANYHFHVEKVEVSSVKVNRKNFSKLNLVGLDDYTGIHYERGFPEIPVIRLYAFAQSRKEISIHTGNDKTNTVEIQNLKNEIIPSQDPLPKIKNARPSFIQFALDKNVGYWPRADYTIDPAGSVKGKKRWLITLYPVRYNPASIDYRFIEDFEVEILNSPIKDESNKQDAMLLIVGNSFKDSPALQKYISFKTQLGLNVQTLTFDKSSMDDLSIRKSIQALYNSTSLNLKYALIVGNIDEVPAHKASHLSEGLVTDHYYRAIDTEDYEEDINGPDIQLGRITPKSENELSQMIEKFITYQKGFFVSEDWLKTPSFIATDDRYKIAEASHNYLINSYTIPLGYQGIFPENPQSGGDKLYAITYKASSQNVVETLKEGRFMITYSGHGGTDQWVGPQVTQSDVEEIGQRYASPFVASFACITAQLPAGNTFAETWLKNSAILYWGSMDSSYWNEDDVLERALGDRIFKEGSREFGDITNYALGEVWRHYNGNKQTRYYWETYTTLGDPSLELRLRPTTKISLEGPQELTLQDEVVQYQVLTSQGAPVKNINVALTKETSVIASTKTDSEGRAKLFIRGIDVGDRLTLTAYGKDTRLSERNILVKSTTVPYLFLGNFTVNGLTSSTLTPYDSVTLNFLVKNVANTFVQAKISLESIEGPAEILSSQKDLPRLAPNEIYKMKGEEFKIRIHDGAPNEKIVLKIRWTTDDGASQVITQSFKLKRGRLSITQIDFGDSQVIENGSLGPGDQGPLYLTLQNTGNDSIVNARLTPGASSCLSQLSGELNIPLLKAGEKIRLPIPLNAQVSSNCTTNERATFSLEGHTQGILPLPLHAQGLFPLGRYSVIQLSKPNWNMAIPDQGQIVIPIDISSPLQLKSLSLKMKATHSSFADLKILLVAPNETTIVLVDQFSDFEDEMILDLNEQNPLFTQFYEQEAQGIWKIIVQDSFSSDTGTIDSLFVRLKGLRK